MIAGSLERYSFSKISTFVTCKYGYYRRYIEHKKGIGNCFSSYGTFLHSILEKYSNGEFDLWDLVDLYKREFDNSVPEPFPNTKFCPNMRQLYYEQGLNFFQNFNGKPDIKILEVESAMSTKLMIGFSTALSTWLMKIFPAGL